MNPPCDLTVGLDLRPYGDPRGMGVSCERCTPVLSGRVGVSKGLSTYMNRINVSRIREEPPCYALHKQPDVSRARRGAVGLLLLCPVKL